MIRHNLHKYSVSAMCKVLHLPRSTYYYETKQKTKQNKDILEATIVRIFKESRSNYGARKIKVELNKEGYQVSRRRIGRIMKVNGLVSKYTIAQFNPHIDKCNKFKNKAIDETLEAFHINRSLSMKECPYDNAVAEATFKIIKTEFVKDERFDSLNELQYKLDDYVNWFNNYRIHSLLGYLTPYQYKMNNLKKVV